MTKITSDNKKQVLAAGVRQGLDGWGADKPMPKNGKDAVSGQTREQMKGPSPVKNSGSTALGLENSENTLQLNGEDPAKILKDRQKQAADLAMIQNDLETIKESIDLPLILVDETMTVRQFNQSADLLFKDAELRVGDTLASAFSGGAASNRWARIASAIQKGATVTNPLEQDGRSYLERIVPVKGNANHKGALLTYTDTTTEKAMVQALDESQERVALAIRASNCGIWDWNLKNNQMHWSNLFLQILGIEDEGFKPSLEELLGRIHQEDRQEIKDILNAHLQRGFDFNVEFRIRRNDDEYIWVNGRGQATWDADRKPIRMICSITDITDRRVALDQISESNASLQRFAYVCSHDLKEPARLMENFADLLQSDCYDDLPEQGREYLDVISKSSRRMQEMIKGILNYTQTEYKHLHFQDVDTAKIIKQVLENLKLSIEETGAAIKIADLPVVRADEVQLLQLFQNLIGNALKFIKDDQPKISINVQKQNHDWVFEVKDNGIGMEEINRQKVFDVFQRLNNQDDFEGHGLGLSICQTIVKKHGGRIWVESEPGKGSSFFFSLPSRSRRKRV